MADIEKLNLSMAGERCDDAVLPCPFCGGEPILIDWYIKGICNTKHYKFRCKAGCCIQFNEYRSIKKATEAWNRRADNG